MDLRAFAEEWEAGWNAHDLDRILNHYADGVVFRSKKAVQLVGTGELHGKRALRSYWQKALVTQPELHFKTRDVFFGYHMLVISYENHQGVLAAETLRFGPDGLVMDASACHRQV